MSCIRSSCSKITYGRFVSVNYRINNYRLKTIKISNISQKKFSKCQNEMRDQDRVKVNRWRSVIAGLGGKFEINIGKKSIGRRRFLWLNWKKETKDKNIIILFVICVCVWSRDENEIIIWSVRLQSFNKIFFSLNIIIIHSLQSFSAFLCKQYKGTKKTKWEKKIKFIIWLKSFFPYNFLELFFKEFYSKMLLLIN